LDRANSNVFIFENVKNVLLNNVPLKSTQYEPSKSTFGMFKETFGELCSNIKNIVIFFIVSILVYIMFSIYIDK
jgi:hypothetical protein